MRKQLIQDAAYEVATQSRVVEDGIEVLLAELAELQTKLIGASSCASVSYDVLQESFEGVAATINDLVKARGTMARCHVAMSTAKQKIPGLRTVSWGDGMPCPPKIAQADLRVVA
jgi:hypothetical protein